FQRAASDFESFSQPVSWYQAIVVTARLCAVSHISTDDRELRASPRCLLCCDVLAIFHSKNELQPLHSDLDDNIDGLLFIFSRFCGLGWRRRRWICVFSTHAAAFNKGGPGFTLFDLDGWSRHHLR